MWMIYTVNAKELWIYFFTVSSVNPQCNVAGTERKKKKERKKERKKCVCVCVCVQDFGLWYDHFSPQVEFLKNIFLYYKWFSSKKRKKERKRERKKERKKEKRKKERKKEKENRQKGNALSVENAKIWTVEIHFPNSVNKSCKILSL